MKPAARVFQLHPVHIATKHEQLTISMSTINDTDYFENGISKFFFCYNFLIEVQVTIVQV
jgi:hypothetical protein